jgi:hypothetical protein
MNDILSTFLYVTNCTWKMFSEHELIFCSLVLNVHNDDLMHAKYIFFNEKVKMVKWRPL